MDKDPETNTVTIGSEEDLLATECEVAEANWLVDDEVGLDWTNCSARHRYNGEAAPAKFRRTPGGSGQFDVIFDEPQRAVTPGQALVVYDSAEPDRVLGGGWIASIR